MAAFFSCCSASRQGIGGTTPLSTNEQTITTVWRAQGCDKCNHTGYKGRIGIYEALSSSLTIQKLITANATSDQIQSQAIKEGMLTMQSEGLIKMFRGATTVEEVLRVTKD